MNQNDKTTPTTPPANRPATKLNLTPEQAQREAAKLHELRDDLEMDKTPDDTAARSSPLGRSDE